MPPQARHVEMEGVFTLALCLESETILFIILMQVSQKNSRPAFFPLVLSHSVLNELLSQDKFLSDPMTINIKTQICPVVFD